MKKIVALVLSLVMVLGLATTAFAAADQYDMYKADKTLGAMLALEKPAYSNQEFEEVAAKTNADGTGNVAYLVNTDAANPSGAPAYWVKTTTPTTGSYAVTAEGKTDILFYINKADVQDPAAFTYKAAVTEFTNFGLKCGQLYLTPDSDDVYFQTATTLVYKAAAAPTTNIETNYLLDGEVVGVDSTFTSTVGAQTIVGAYPIDHSFAATNYTYDSVKKVNVPTEATCTTCLLTTTSIYKDGKVPATYSEYALTNGNGYVVGLAPAGAAAPSTPAVDADKVESAETFDAGIAMYVGMSVMAAAGSAVVLKKKD